MNKNFSRSVLFFVTLLIFCQRTSHAMYQKGDYSFAYQEPSFRQKALSVGLDFGLNLALNTTSIFYSIFVQNYATEVYRNFRASFYKPDLKSYLPENDERFVLPKNISEIMEEMSSRPIPPSYKNAPSNEADQVRKHLLLHGVNGVGKTSVAEVMAARMNAYYLVLSGAHFTDKSTNGILKAIRAFGKKAHSENRRLVVLLDELSVMRSRFSKNSKEAAKKASVIDALLPELLKLPENIICVGTTNNRYVMDKALLDRFKERLEVGLPNLFLRKNILENYLKTHAFSGEVINYVRNEFAEYTDGFTCRNLSDLVSSAHTISMAKGKKYIDNQCINRAFYRVLPEVEVDTAREIASCNKYLSDEQYAPHFVRLEQEKEVLTARLARIQNLLKNATQEDVEDEVKEKEIEVIEHYENDTVYTPQSYGVNNSTSIYATYLSNCLCWSKSALNSKPAYVAYGGLTVGLAAYGLIKTGVLDVAPRLVYQ